MNRPDFGETFKPAEGGETTLQPKRGSEKLNWRNFLLTNAFINLTWWPGVVLAAFGMSRDMLPITVASSLITPAVVIAEMIYFNRLLPSRS